MRSVALLPSVALLAGTCAGVAIATPVPGGRWLLAALWMGAALAWRWRRDDLVVGTVAAGYTLAGLLLGSDAAAAALDPPLRFWLDREIGGFDIRDADAPPPHDPVLIEGRLLEDALPRDGVVSVRLAVERITIAGTQRKVHGGIRLTIAGDAVVRRAPELRAGRTIEAPVAFRRPARYLNHGVPDFERDQALDGIALNATAKSALLVRIVRRGTVFDEAAADIRNAVRSRVARRVGRHDLLASAIVTAILIGDRTGLPDDVRARLQAAGTYHVIAISGGNIAILVALVAGAMLLTGLHGRRSVAAVIAAVLAYAAIVNGGPSVWRATATAVAYLSARLLDHRSPPWNAMAVSAAVLIGVAPLDVRDAGFALTFGATAAIVEAARRLQRRGETPRARRPRWQSWLIAGVVASAAAETVLLPISASVFSRVTSAGLVLNLLAVPLMSVAQVAGLAVAVADPAGWVAAPAGAVAAAAARGLVESARLVDVAPWLTLRVPPPSLSCVAFYYASLAAALWLPSSRLFPPRSWRFASPLALSPRAIGMVSLVLAAGLVLAGAAPAVRPDAAPGVVRLAMFDVGQGEAVLVQTPTGRAVMVDAGGIGFDGSGFDIGGRVLTPALWAHGVARLDVLALTHGDPDHIGGAASLVRDFRPAAVWEGVPVPRHAALQAVLALARAHGAIVERRHSPAATTLDGVQIRVLHPPAPDWERQRVRNDDSLVLEIRYGAVAMLLTGDIGADVERSLVPHLTPAPTRVLKVAHHGSRTSTGELLLEAWTPQVAVLSCGRGNRFGHPATEVIARLERRGVRVYRTDREGEIEVRTDGARVWVSTFLAPRSAPAEATTR